jgi:hypothetical protein
VATETVAVDKSKKAGKDCQGIAMTDPLYKANNCGAMKGGPGASAGEGHGSAAGASGAAGSSSSSSSSGR